MQGGGQGADGHWLDASSLQVEHLLDCNDLVDFLDERHTFRQDDHPLVPTGSSLVDDFPTATENTSHSLDNHNLVHNDSHNDNEIDPPSTVLRDNFKNDNELGFVDESDNYSSYQFYFNFDEKDKGSIMKLDHCEPDRRSNTDFVHNHEAYAAFIGFGDIEDIFDTYGGSQSNSPNSSGLDHRNKSCSQHESSRESSSFSEDAEPEADIIFENGSRKFQNTHQQSFFCAKECDAKALHLPESHAGCTASGSLLLDKPRHDTSSTEQRSGNNGFADTSDPSSVDGFDAHRLKDTSHRCLSIDNYPGPSGPHGELGHSGPSTSSESGTKTEHFSRKVDHTINYRDIPPCTSSQNNFSVDHPLHELKVNCVDSVVNDLFAQPSSSQIIPEKLKRSRHQSLPDMNILDFYQDHDDILRTIGSIQMPTVDINGNFDAHERHLTGFSSPDDAPSMPFPELGNIDSHRSMCHYGSSDNVPILPTSTEHSQTTHNAFSCPSTADDFLCDTNNTSIDTSRKAQHSIQSFGQRITLGDISPHNSSYTAQGTNANFDDFVNDEKCHFSFQAAPRDILQASVPAAIPKIPDSTTSRNSVFGNNNDVCVESRPPPSNPLQFKQPLRQKHENVKRIGNDHPQNKVANGVFFPENESSMFHSKTLESVYQMHYFTKEANKRVSTVDQPDSSAQRRRQVIRNILDRHISSRIGSLSSQQSEKYLKQQATSACANNDMIPDHFSLYEKLPWEIGLHDGESVQNSTAINELKKPGVYPLENVTNEVFPKNDTRSHEGNGFLRQQRSDHAERKYEMGGCHLVEERNSPDVNPREMNDSNSTGKSRTGDHNRAVMMKIPDDVSGHRAPLQLPPEMATDVDSSLRSVSGCAGVLKEPAKQASSHPVKCEMESESDEMDDSLKEAYRQATTTGDLMPMIKQELKRKIIYKRCVQGKGEINDEPPPKRVSELTDEEKERKKRTRERNRLAALRCRKKNKVKRQQQEKELEHEQEINVRLWQQIKTLNAAKDKAVGALVGVGIPAHVLQHHLSSRARSKSGSK